MLSVVIETRNDEDALARTLSSLVAAAVEGLVREVIVCDLGSDDQTHRVADHAGCNYLREGGLAAGIARARSEWLLLLEPGARLVDGWGEAVTVHTTQGTGPARFCRSAHARRPLLARLFSRRRPLAEGLLITKRQALALTRVGVGAEALARGVAARRIAGEIVPAPKASRSR